MNKLPATFLLWHSLLAVACLLPGGLLNARETSIPVVEVRPSGSGYQLYRDNKPYFIRGAGGVDHFGRLAAAGGNSVRTWGTEQTLAVLPAARRHQLTVAAGLWIEHQRHGFDYDDPEAVREQIKRHKAAIDQLRHHPEILLWSIGNEVWIQADNPRVWEVIEEVAAHAKSVDPMRPTMTVLPHVSAGEVEAIQRFCPSIDILGINTYGGIATAAGEARSAGWQGPIIIAEWGVTGNWEQPTTAWGAELEPTSTEKSHQFALHYSRILAEPAILGSYAFYWGQKQETTPTWFNLFLASDHAIGPVDTLTFLWTGKFPEKTAPEISPIRLNGQRADDNIRVDPADPLFASFTLLDADDPDAIKVHWECRPESRHKGIGGDAERVPPAIPLAEARSYGHELFSCKAPTEKGPYRLFLYVTTPHGKAATANIPFHVQ